MPQPAQVCTYTVEATGQPVEEKKKKKKKKKAAAVRTPTPNYPVSSLLPTTITILSLILVHILTQTLIPKNCQL